MPELEPITESWDGSESELKFEVSGFGLLEQTAFQKMLYIEQRRTERSGTGFVLVVLRLKKSMSADSLTGLVRALTLAVRETDISGWYRRGSQVGVIFTEIGTEDRSAIVHTLLTKIGRSLADHLGESESQEIELSAHIYPEEKDGEERVLGADTVLYPEIRSHENLNKAIKRSMDIAGSLAALIFMAPLFGAVALAVKLTSKGPILFRQKRVGQNGRHFTFLKFRSMYADNNPRIHQEYVKQLIAGEKSAGKDGPKDAVVAKMKSDPRITPIGRFLRRTSLDELPQFLNVLQGEMSLVGPRPPIPYEVACYQLWHQRRSLAVKPGITGLWQVAGRSRVSFDEMVRMDIRYAMTWTPWMDLKILLRTPWAVLSAEGAF